MSAVAETTVTEVAEAEEHTEESSIHVSLKPETIFNIGSLPVTN